MQGLRLTSFRNLADGAVNWAAGLNIVSGENGQGKTNLLEAVFFLSTGRSFRTSQTTALIRSGTTQLRVAGQVECGGIEHQLAVETGGNRRRRTLDGKGAGLDAILPFLACIVFSSARLELFRGGPEERRRFLDRGLVALHPELIGLYRDHARALRQKNELLRRAREMSPPQVRQQVQAFNGRLAAAGLQLRLARKDYVDRLQSVLKASADLAQMVPGGPPELVYLPSPELPPEMDEDVQEAALLEALDSHLDQELRRGHALIGPQRDNLALRQTGKDLILYGSAGQQRATLMTLKVCKMFVHKELRGEYPVLLVDDVDAELDAERTRRALRLLDGPFQAIVASARGGEWAGTGGVTRHLALQNGIITECP